MLIQGKGLRVLGLRSGTEDSWKVFWWQRKMPGHVQGPAKELATHSGV